MSAGRHSPPASALIGAVGAARNGWRRSTIKLQQFASFCPLYRYESAESCRKNLHVAGEICVQAAEKHITGFAARSGATRQPPPQRGMPRADATVICAGLKANEAAGPQIWLASSPRPAARNRKPIVPASCRSRRRGDCCRITGFLHHANMASVEVVVQFAVRVS